MTRIGVLDDHRRLAAATLRVLAGAAVALTAALLLTGRSHSVPGVVAGALVAGLNVVLLARALSRFPGAGSEPAAPTPRAITSGLMTRFFTVAFLIGLLMASRQLQPVSVLAGFLLLPLAVVSVGARAAGREHRRVLAEGVHAR